MLTEKGSNFLRYRDAIEEGDTVVVYVNPGTQYNVVVKRGHTLHMKYGALRHEFLIGKRYGTAISATAGYVYALRVNPNLWTRTLQKKTQILYTPDIATIMMLLDVKPGSRICETGTGSGSLTHAIATTVAPHGHLYSFDIDESRVRIVQGDLKQHGLSDVATIEVRDVTKDGFSDSVGSCDGIFLDLPAPWLVIEHAKKVLLNSSNPNGGRLVSFSPCIEQVQQVCTELESHGFVQIETVELVPQKMKVVDTTCESLLEFAAQGSNAPRALQQLAAASRKRKAEPEPTAGDEQPGSQDTLPPNALEDAIPYPSSQPTHTGYITSATILPPICQKDGNEAKDPSPSSSTSKEQ